MDGQPSDAFALDAAPDDLLVPFADDYHHHHRRAATLASPRPLPSSPHPASPSHPSDDAIEAVIQMATSSRASPAAPVKDTRTQLFVGNLPYRVRWQDLKDLFRRAGTVLRADVSLGPDNRSRGYGTVLLATAEDAGRAVDMFNGYNWQTRILEVRPDRLPPPDLDSSLAGMGNTLHSAGFFPTAVQPGYDDWGDLNAFLAHQLRDPSSTLATPTRNLFVGNLPFHCQWQDLKDLFRQAGTIIRADVALGPDGRSRGFGTVVFSTEHDAERALQMFNGYEYNGRVLKVHYDKYSLLGQMSNTMPASPALSAQQTAHAILSQPLPRAPSNLQQFPSSFTPNDIAGLLSSFQAQHFQRSPRLSQAHPSSSTQDSSANKISSPEISHPKPHPLQQMSRAGSSAASSTSGSSNPNSFDMESIATSLSSVSNYAPSASGGSISSPAVPTKRATSPSSSQATEKKKAVKSVPASPPRAHPFHPHHPGTITLPPPPPLPPFPISPVSSSASHATPVHHPPSSHPQYHLTPHGLPPITPSMPAFMFYAPPQHSPHGGHPSPQMIPMHHFQHPHTPTGMTMVYNPSPIPLHTPPIMYPMSTPPVHMSIGGHVFSPMSPGAFWAGGSANPFINPTVGEPVRPSSAEGSDGGEEWSAGYKQPEPTGYFDLGYFPPLPSQPTSSSSNEPSSSDPSSVDGGTAVEAGDDVGIHDHAPSRALSMTDETKPPLVTDTRRIGSDPQPPTLASQKLAAAPEDKA